MIVDAAAFFGASQITEKYSKGASNFIDQDISKIAYFHVSIIVGSATPAGICWQEMFNWHSQGIRELQADKVSVKLTYNYHHLYFHKKPHQGSQEIREVCYFPWQAEVLTWIAR